MQNETHLYELPADRMVFTHERLGAGRELGEAEIVNTMWGKAKVRIIRKEGNSGWTWLLAALGGLAAIAVVWYLVARPNLEGSTPSEPAPPVPTPNVSVAPQQGIDNSAAGATPVQADVTANPAPPPAPSASTEKLRSAPEKPQPAASMQMETVQAETPHPSPARSGKRRPASDPSPINTPAPDVKAKQPESTENPVSQTVQENPPATSGGDTSAAAPPVKAEPPKSDPTDSHP